MIAAPYLVLTIAEVLALHAQRGPNEPASIESITRALESLDAQLAAIAADRAAKDRAWLAEQIGSLTTELAPE